VNDQAPDLTYFLKTEGYQQIIEDKLDKEFDPILLTTFLWDNCVRLYGFGY